MCMRVQTCTCVCVCLHIHVNISWTWHRFFLKVERVKVFRDRSKYRKVHQLGYQERIIDTDCLGKLGRRKLSSGDSLLHTTSPLLARHSSCPDEQDGDGRCPLGPHSPGGKTGINK